MAVYRPKGGGGGGGGGATADGFGKNRDDDRDETTNFMYLNPESRSKGYDGLAHGIGFGGASDQPRIFLDEGLDACRASVDDLTFEKGPLLSSSSLSRFEVLSLEAWGTGNDDVVVNALSARDDMREETAKRIRKALKGAKGQVLEDFQSGLAGGKVYQHREQMRGKDGGCDMDEEEGGAST